MNDSENLKKLRDQIDIVDSQIHHLLNQRATLALRVSEEKINQGNSKNLAKHFYRPEREAEIFEKIKNHNQGPLSNQKVLLIFREILSACLALESPLKVAFLGPVGTFTQQATFKHFGSSIDSKPVNTIEGVFRLVELENASFGVVPVENSSEGVVSSTLDCLQDSALKICGEIQIQINHQLLVLDKKSKIKTIYAHPQSFAQCKSFLAENYPNAELKNVTSNGVGAELAREKPNSAAIASEVAAQIYKLQVLKENLQDSSQNITRFLVVGKYSCEPSHSDKTSLLLSTSNSPGSLYTMLKPFEKYQINMSKIESRPSKLGQWEYVFFIDVDIHSNHDNFKKAIAEIESHSHFVKILGSYPRSIKI